MESIQEYLKRLANQSTLINSEEPLPYILTPEEEEKAVSYAIEQKKKHLSFRLAGAGFSEMEILSKIAKVQWDLEIDKQEIITTANSRKNHLLWEKEQRANEKIEQEKQEQIEVEKRKMLKEMFNSVNMRLFAKDMSVKYFDKPFILNDHTEKLLITLSCFLADDYFFETGLNLSFKKGILLRGTSGLGKTYIPQCLKDNLYNPIDILNILEITDYVKEDGKYDISWKKRILYLDDLGTEQTPIKFYGTEINWFKDFIEMYYAKNLPWNRLMISTNLNFEGITEKYGYRVTSRMKEMFNVVNVEGKDLRTTVNA